MKVKASNREANLYVDNFYGEPGCCLFCPDKKKGCLCYDCHCRKCAYYSYGKCVAFKTTPTFRLAREWDF